MHDERVTQAVFEAIDEFNEVEGRNIERSLDAVLFGEAGQLDSMGLVTLVLTVEAKAQQQLGSSISLTDDRALSQRNSPFRTVRTLVQYIDALLGDHDG